MTTSFKPTPEQVAREERYAAMTVDAKITHNEALLTLDLPDRVRGKIKEKLHVLRVEHGRYDCDLIRAGVLYASVCSRLDLEATTAWVNANSPTGIRSCWAPVTDPTFTEGQPNPCPCDKHPSTHRHLLFSC